MNTRLLRRLATPLLLLGATLLLVPLTSEHKAFAEQVSDTPLTRVVVAVVDHAPSQHTHTFYGVTTAAEQTRIAFPMPGRMVARAVDVGDRVFEGQVVAQLDDQPLRNQEQAARAQLNQFDAELEQLDRESARADRLLAANAGTAQGAEQVRARRDAVLAARAGATASRREARRQRGETSLNAPHDGVVVAVLAEPGEVVAAGAPVLVIANPNAIEVAIEVPEAVHAALVDGQPASIELPFSGGPAAPGHIDQLGSVTLGVGRLFPVVVALDGPGRSAGAAAEVQLSVPRPPGLSVPMSAIVNPSGDSPGVWRLIDNRAVWSPVALLGASDGLLRVSGDLNAGDRVITLGHSSLYDGEVVEAAE
ncbi:MAG: RND family efflux transporter MFP subunit [Bradymonadia bacterium]|jgi:RND family efflux transporter MFP subunit